MIKNYLVVAWRNLIRNKIFSAINITGLALGIACSLLILLWVQDERSIDAFHRNGKDLYQVYERQYYDGKVDAAYPTQGLLAEELEKAIPEVRFATGLESASAPGALSTLQAGTTIVKMNGSFASHGFFDMFSFPLLYGTSATALQAPASIAISEKMARIFFGSAEKAIGKTLRYEDKEDLVVTAVFENPPVNSSLQFDFLRTWTDYVKQNQWVHNWGNTSPVTVILLRADANATKVEAEIKDFIYRYRDKDRSFISELALQPFTDTYLHSVFKNGQIDGGRIEYVRLFTIVALIILLIACINFMNLSTARAAKRAKEVGVRKVVGAGRFVLIKQFIGEAILLTTIASIIAFVVVIVALPAFNGLTGKQLILPVTQLKFWLGLSSLILLTGFIAGSYPALFLSALNPVQVLKSSLKFSWSATFFRKSLVVFQFSLAIVLIVGMIVIYTQLKWVQSKNLGYDRTNLVYIPIEGELTNNYAVFKEKAAMISGISSVTKMRNSPTVIEHHTNSIDWAGKEPNLAVSFADAVVGYDFVKTMNLTLTEGRDFSPAYGTDSTAYLLNETAVKKIGFDKPVGKTVVWGNRPGRIIGVIKDFHFNSMHQAIDPLIVRLNEKWSWGTILVRTERGSTREALTGLQKICKEINPKFPFTYQFSDEAFSRLYKSEEVVSRLSNYFALFAIFISCLGLFGMAMFTSAQRTKEIGVRKVLGASVLNITTILTIHFLTPVAIGILIAIPVSLYTMNNWLQGFAYKITLQWWMFAAAGFAALVVALATVGFQAIKAAIANPVKSLRSDQ